MSRISIHVLAALLIGPVAGGSAAEAAACTAQSTGVSFGKYDTLDPSPLDGVGDVIVQCDAAVPFTIDLGPGGGTIGERLMSGAGGTLNYNLYTDATRTVVWGDGMSGGDVSSSGANVTTTVYGRIPARQNVVAGAYSDLITVTVSY
jgi:spore coat protein U-like protein